MRGAETKGEAVGTVPFDLGAEEMDEDGLVTGDVEGAFFLAADWGSLDWIFPSDFLPEESDFEDEEAVVLRTEGVDLRGGVGLDLLSLAEAFVLAAMVDGDEGDEAERATFL